MDDGEAWVPVIIFLILLAGVVGSCIEDAHTRDADEEVGARGQECYANNTCDGALVCFRIDADETRCEPSITPVKR